MFVSIKTVDSPCFIITAASVNIYIIYEEIYECEATTALGSGERRRRIINTYVLPSYIACCGGPIYNNVFSIHFRYISCTNGLEVAMFIAS